MRKVTKNSQSMSESKDPGAPSWRTLPPSVRLWALFSMHLMAGFLIGTIATSASVSWIVGDASQGWPISLVRFGLAWSSAFIYALPVLLFTQFFPQEKFLLQHVSRNPLAHVGWKPFLLLPLLVLVFIPGDDMLHLLNRSFMSTGDLLEIEASRKSVEPIVRMPLVNDLLMNIAMISVLGTICQELFYRGAVLSLFTRWLRNVHAAVWITALISTLLQYELSAFLPRFVFSGMLGYLFIYGRSLWLPVVTSVLYSTLSFVYIYYADQYPAIESALTFPYWIGPLSIGAAATLILLIRRINEPKLPEPPVV